MLFTAFGYYCWGHKTEKKSVCKCDQIPITGVEGVIVRLCASISLAICQKYSESKLPSNLLPRKLHLNFVISPFSSTGLLLNSIRFSSQSAHSDNEYIFGIVNTNVIAKSTVVTENCLVFTQIWLHVQSTSREMPIVHKIDGGQV